MKVGFAPQYGTPSVVVEETSSPEAIIKFAEEAGAIFRDHDTDEGEVDYVVDFQDDPSRLVGPELYTKDALLE